MISPEGIMHRLMEVIEDRHVRPRENSYTAKLMEGGVQRIGEKIMEEAGEFVEAAGNAGTDGIPAARTLLIYEAADLVYHFLVMLGHCDIKLTDVEMELARRFGTSGLDEKVARGEGKGQAKES